MGKLIVVAGIPGTRIKAALRRLAEFAETNHNKTIRVFSLEDEFVAEAQPRVQEIFGLPKPSVIHSFLLPRVILRQAWRESFEKVWANVTTALQTDDVVLTLHLAYFHQLTNEYLVPGHIPTLAKTFGDVDAVMVTLVDDVYDCHHALVGGGTGMLEPPQSTESVVLDLLQILDWRSIELMLADSLAHSADMSNYVMAVKHPIATLYDMLFSTKPIVYLSHPISEIRRLHNAGHTQDARKFVEHMGTVLARVQADATVIEPTAIDELRFDSEGRAGNLQARWPFSEDEREMLWVAPIQGPTGSGSLFYPSGWSEDERADIPTNELLGRLSKTIAAQINARDHALVEQSTSLACYRPLYEGNPSRGVREELQHVGRLIKFGVRGSQGSSVVYSPEEDRAALPLRTVLENMIPEWRKRGLLTGEESEFQALDHLIRTGGVDVDGFLQGDAAALLKLVATAGVQVDPESMYLPTGALGSTKSAHIQAAAQKLAEGMAAAGEIHFDELVEHGIIRLVSTEQQFYHVLNEDLSREEPTGDES